MKIIVVLSLLGIALGNPLDRFPNRESRIINGQLAPAGAFPYLVSFRAFVAGIDDIHYCGGSIISPRTVLTAGHCVDWLPATAIEIVYGSNQLDCKGIRYRVTNSLLHPNYNDTDFTYDIGMAFVGQDFKYSPTVQPIEIDYSLYGGGLSVTSMGWGRIVPDVVTPSNDLLFINETTITNADCQTRLPPVFREVLDGEMCTLTPSGTGSCSGDAGGPVVMNNKVIGITALGYGCASEYPEVAVRVSYYQDWIEENTI